VRLLPRLRRTWPAWAEPGRTYRCNDKCGYRFTLQPDGTWEKTGTGSDRVIASWSDLMDREPDCSRRLQTVYGGQHAADQARARRFPRWTLTCSCRGLSPHLHYRGHRWFV
jgi:hypothetical protein